jgi:molecular chaperone IbpA
MTDNNFHREDGAVNAPNRNRNRNAFGNLKLSPFAVGFEELADKWLNLIDEETSSTKYPPYNIVKYDDTNYAIQIAVAGFTRDEISMEYKDGTLTVTGKELKPQDVDSDYTPPVYLHKGIATRDFNHAFKLADEVEVTEAEIIDGILYISLLKHIPEHQKAKTITII